MVQATDVGVRKSLTASLAAETMESFMVTTVKFFFALVREVAAEQDGFVSDTKVRLSFVKSGYLKQEYIPTVRYFYLDSKFIIRNPVECEIGAQRVLGMDSLRFSGVQRNMFVPVSGAKEYVGGLGGEKILPQFGIGVKWSNESYKYVFLPYMDSTFPMYFVNKTIGCVCFGWNVDDAMCHSLSRGTIVPEQVGLREG